MSRVGVIADTHGNLPATQAVMSRLAGAGCAEVFHLGDAIGMGPHPSEVVSLLVTSGVRCVMGNHDELFLHGLPDPPPAWMSAGEVAHHHWVHAQLDAAHRSVMRTWPYARTVQLGRQTVVLVHYARRPGGAFDRVAEPTAEDFDRMYAGARGDVVVFGHDHRPHDLVLNGRRFLNPGSVGCHDRPEARALILEPVNGRVEASKVAVPYDDSVLMRGFTTRAVPDRDLILRTFMRRPTACASAPPCHPAPDAGQRPGDLQPWPCTLARPASNPT